MTSRRAETLRRRWVRLMQLATFRTPEERKRARALARKVKAEMQREFIRERERQERGFAQAIEMKRWTMDYPFTQQDAQQAYDTWGANCGPGALAFCLQVHINAIRGKIPEFESKHYTSPTMMLNALKTLNKVHQPVNAFDEMNLFNEVPALTRVQWTGPWTEPGANPRWAYRQTHWICTWLRGAVERMVFDINGGIMRFTEWQTEIVPALTALYPRADGGWKATHIWRIKV